MKTCPICLDEITNECFTSCNHSFCLECILEWSKNHTCPCCRDDLKLTDTQELRDLKAEIELLKNSKIIRFFSMLEGFFTNITNSF